jgi:hypothetical protein
LWLFCQVCSVGGKSKWGVCLLREAHLSEILACSFLAHTLVYTQIHNSMLAEFKYALVWGLSSKHYPQRYVNSCYGNSLLVLLWVFIVRVRVSV